ncbi:unnamed protein product [Plutella xylostella]|uniref:(diamondback moth) hypothetical protein n=1 Tax=Plutella xylostella TaxID=51655 RepID=A0A8S4D6L6_PLUXY|nr:unnamed protein product [Plutella xylostella]
MSFLVKKGIPTRAACLATGCLLAAAALADERHSRQPLLSAAALLQMQTKLEDAKDIAYLLFYLSPKSKLEAFLVAVSHTYLLEYEQAISMYRYSLSFDDKFLPAKACLHATMCLMIFGENAIVRPKQT